MRNIRKQFITTKPISEKTIVIIGASSGIGRATALEFAKKGSTLILVARREGVLNDLAAECLASGSKQAIAVKADVTDAKTLENVVATALKESSSIDVWINNVGAGAVGELNEIPLEVHEQIIRTSLIGHLNGTYAILPAFKKQGYGVLINTISLGAWVPEPYAVAYTASKYGLRGLSESLRCELIHWPGIAVCDVYPAYIDTPGFQHGANYTGKKLKPMPPVFPAERVARTMVKLASHPRNTVPVGETALAFKWMHALCPSLTRRVVTGIMDNYFQRAKRAPISNGHVFESTPLGSGVSGGWISKEQKATVPIAVGALIAGVLTYFLVKSKGNGLAVEEPVAAAGRVL